MLAVGSNASKTRVKIALVNPFCFLNCSLEFKENWQKRSNSIEFYGQFSSFGTQILIIDSVLLVRCPFLQPSHSKWRNSAITSPITGLEEMTLTNGCLTCIPIGS